MGTGFTRGIRNAGTEIKSSLTSIAQPIYLSEHMTNIPDPVENCSYLPFTDQSQLTSAGDNTIPTPSSYVNNNLSKKPIMNAEHMTNSVNQCTENSFTSNFQLESARNNTVEGSELDSVVSSFKNQYNVQGMYSNYVNGYGGGDYSSY